MGNVAKAILVIAVVLLISEVGYPYMVNSGVPPPEKPQRGVILGMMDTVVIDGSGQPVSSSGSSASGSSSGSSTSASGSSSSSSASGSSSSTNATSSTTTPPTQASTYNPDANNNVNTTSSSASEKLSFKMPNVAIINSSSNTNMRQQLGTAVLPTYTTYIDSMVLNTTLSGTYALDNNLSVTFFDRNGEAISFIQFYGSDPQFNKGPIQIDLIAELIKQINKPRHEGTVVSYNRYKTAHPGDLTSHIQSIRKIDLRIETNWSSRSIGAQNNELVVNIKK